MEYPQIFGNSCPLKQENLYPTASTLSSDGARKKAETIPFEGLFKSTYTYLSEEATYISLIHHNLTCKILRSMVRRTIFSYDNHSL